MTIQNSIAGCMYHICLKGEKKKKRAGPYVAASRRKTWSGTQNERGQGLRGKRFHAPFPPRRVVAPKTSLLSDGRTSKERHRLSRTPPIPTQPFRVFVGYRITVIGIVAVESISMCISRDAAAEGTRGGVCLLYTSPSPRD